MRSTRRAAATVAVTGSLVAALLAAAGTANGAAELRLSSAGAANPKAPGLTSPNRLSPELAAIVRAQGSGLVENPQDGIGYYGYDSVNNTPPLIPVLGGPPPFAEARKTEPDKNAYLELTGQRGPDPSYDYGTRFLFQGHEGGAPGYVTRVNLDADPAHRVTLLATRNGTDQPLPTFDGVTWDPFAKKLLMTAEKGCSGGVWTGDADYRAGATFTEMPALGKGGYEGIQTASDGSIWIVEDIGGKTDPNTKAKPPNSYVYRFTPTTKGELSTGKLEALQVLRSDNATPMTTAETFSQDIKDLHTYGRKFTTRWVTVRDTTEANKTSTFCASELAKTAKATPFKRPENGVFRPGTGFGEFYFTETGDTNLDSTANNGSGGFGGVFRLTQNGPSAATGTIDPFYLGDKEHTGFDNIQFATDTQLMVVEDAGDTLHTQRNALDSGYLFDASKDQPTQGAPLRFLAEGRDPSATIDSALGDAKTAGFANSGDNEITGIHVSDGDPSSAGLLGAKVPAPFTQGWRVFFTQQHGDNVTYEVIPNATGTGSGNVVRLPSGGVETGEGGTAGVEHGREFTLGGLALLAVGGTGVLVIRSRRSRRS